MNLGTRIAQNLIITQDDGSYEWRPEVLELFAQWAEHRDKLNMPTPSYSLRWAELNRTRDTMNINCNTSYTYVLGPNLLDCQHMLTPEEHSNIISIQITLEPDRRPRPPEQEGTVCPPKLQVHIRVTDKDEKRAPIGNRLIHLVQYNKGVWELDADEE